jgi:hypothetical protein
MALKSSYFADCVTSGGGLSIPVQPQADQVDNLK